MRERVERMVFEYDVDEGGKSVKDFASSAAMQALVALSEPLGHVAKGRRAEASSNRWNFATEYYTYAADFHGNHAGTGVDVEKALEGNPRSFDAIVVNTEEVSLQIILLTMCVSVKNKVWFEDV